MTVNKENLSLNNQESGEKQSHENHNENDELMAALEGVSSTKAANPSDNNKLDNIRDKLMSKLSSTKNNIVSQAKSINNLNSTIDDKRQRLIRQEEEIAEKQKIILTRNRMLNIAQANNSYNNKMIYVLISIIFGFFIIMLLMYVHKNKHKNKV
tara:strand:+ start:405 stop:866 length:462 start_codon:yes stop_codon:yes gene_type:complete